jgi:cell division protein FtsB
MAPKAAPKYRINLARALQRAGVALLLLALLGLAGGLMVGFVRMAWQEHQINREMERQKAENAAQAALNLKLKGQADFAESDVAAELAARERLGMARDGETVLLPTVVLPTTPTPAPADGAAVAAGPATQPTDQPTEAQTNTGRWIKAFFPSHGAVP